ncbi:lipoyl synthase [Acinetobacter sp.]|uniref:lipoyl synthase n=1 Tax=Acinetobacter sp. TaxID=472 RepID=UPI0031E202A4
MNQSAKDNLKSDKLNKYKTQNKAPFETISNTWLNEHVHTTGHKYSPEELKRIQRLFRQQHLHRECNKTTCFEPPQYPEHRAASFIILPTGYARCCPFCHAVYSSTLIYPVDDIQQFTQHIATLELTYLVMVYHITEQMNAALLAQIMQHIRQQSPKTMIEIIITHAQLDALSLSPLLRDTPPDVLNCPVSAVPRLFPKLKLETNYLNTLHLLKQVKRLFPSILTKSGLLVGLGEIEAEVFSVLNDLKDASVDLITIGQYLQLDSSHPVIQRFVHLDEFKRYQAHGNQLNFQNLWSSPMVRPSYFAEQLFEKHAIPELL